jgi:DUF1680 family protein
MLESSGTIENFVRAAARQEGGYRLPVFRDSDLYKVLEAIAWDRVRGHVDQMEQFFERMVDLLKAAQLPEGYLNTYVQVGQCKTRFSDPAMGHELYCAGHLIQAAVADARTGGSGRLAEIARAFADYLCDVLYSKWPELTPGHPEVESALVELYRLTGEARYRDLAGTLIERRGYGRLGPGLFGAGYYQDDVPVQEAHTVRGHAVRALYLAAGATDWYIEDGPVALLGAMKAQWADMVGGKTYLTGGVGARHLDEAFGDSFELPADRAYCETCAAIASVMWSWRLLLVTGESRYADLIERTLYNAVAVAVGADGKTFFYVNPLRSRGSHVREKWFECACCPPNLMRLLASLEHYLMTVDGDGVQIHQYASCRASLTLPSNHSIEFDMETSYPWDGHVVVRVRAASDTDISVSLRVPGWSRGCQLRVNGEAAIGPEPLEGNDGYFRVRRTWRRGDKVELDIPMTVRSVVPSVAVDAIRSNVAYERGPLVYCFEGLDIPGRASVEGIRVPSEARASELRGVLYPGEEGVALAVEVVYEAVTTKGWWPYVDDSSGLERSQIVGDAASVRGVPYYAWGNRGRSDMRVWLPRGETR